MPAALKLGDVCEVVMGQAPNGASYNTEGEGIPLLAGAGDLGDTEPTPSRFTSAPTRVSAPGDIILCVRATLGKTNWADQEYCLGRGVAALKALPDRLDSSYLWHWIGTQQKSLERKARGSTFRQVTRDAVESLRIPLPPLPEQRRIAAILDKADAVRRKRQQTLDLADQFLRSAFLDLFGDPVTNPKGWPVRTLSEFYVNDRDGTKCGPFGSALKKDEFVDTGVPVWNMDNIDPSGRTVLPFRMWISEAKYQQLGAYAVSDGDVIISRAGTVGKMCVASSGCAKSVISTNLIRVRFGTDLLPIYFVALMNYCKGRVGRLKTGPDGAFTHMSTGVLDKLKFPYPPLHLQHRFAAIVKSVEQKKASQRAYHAYLHKFLLALQQRAFGGEL